MRMTLKNGIVLSFVLHALIFLTIGLVNLQKATQIESQQTDLALLTEVDTLAQGITEPIAEKPAEKKTVPEPVKKTDKTHEKIGKIAAEKKAAEEIAAEQKAVEEKAVSDRENALIKEKERNALAEEASKLAKAREDEAAARKKEEDEKKAALEAQKEKVKKEINDYSGSIDKALEDEGDQGKQSGGTVASNDPLSGAKWAVKPRKTVYFPDIQSKIPDKYKKKGLGFALTAKIVFDMNGLAIKVDVINSSGDPAIDSIFFTELREVRVEPIEVNRLDEITKTFTISLK